MAENKKSFLLYADLIHTVRKMPKDKAGELLLTILEYVNDEDPVVDDIVVDLVFEPIKQQLKRDLIKYHEKKIQWSEAGKRSAEVRNANKKQRTLTNVKSRSTDSTVNVNDSVSVNDNVTVSDNKVLSELDLVFKDFIEMRKKIKAPLTERAKTLILNKLEKLSEGHDEIKILILERSIMNSWKGVFELEIQSSKKLEVDSKPKQESSNNLIIE